MENPFLFNLGGCLLDYALAISPDLKIDAKVFASAWNQDPESSNIAQAHIAATAKESYPFISPEIIHEGLVLLTGIASTVALDVVKDVVKDGIKKILTARKKSDDAFSIEVIVIQTKDAPVIVVKAKS
jgi:hypothetical protein